VSGAALKGTFNTIKLREYMCVSGTDALASASVWVKLRAYTNPKEAESLLPYSGG
jgi:hypothetical protein